MYTIKKISINRHLADRTPFYECVLRHESWQELTKDVSARNIRNCPTMLHKGSHIFENDNLIGNTRDLILIPGKINSITKKEFLSWQD